MKRSGLVNFSWFFNVCSSTDLSVCRRGGGWWCDCQWGGECCCESSSLESKWAKNDLINNQKGWRFYPCGLRTVFVPAKHLSTDSIKSLLVAWKHRKMLARKSGFVLKLNCDWLGKWQEFFQAIAMHSHSNCMIKCTFNNIAHSRKANLSLENEICKVTQSQHQNKLEKAQKKWSFMQLP